MQPATSPRSTHRANRLVTAICEFARLIVDHVLTWLIVTVLIGIGPGLCLANLLHAPDFTFIAANNLPTDQRWQMAGLAGLSCAIVLALYVLSWRSARRQSATTDWRDHAKKLNRRFLPLAGLPLLAGLLNNRMEVDEPVLVLAVVVFEAVLVGIWRYRLALNSPEIEANDSPVHRTSAKRAAIVAALLACAYAGVVSWLAITDHRNLGTHTFDLGIYNNVIWRTSQGDFLACSFCRGDAHVAAHFDPILLLFAPLHRLWTSAEMLLTLQTVWLASGAIPLFLWGQKRLGSPWYGTWLVLVYVLTPALQGVNLFDFHSLALVIPTSLWLMYLLEIGRGGAYFGVLAIVLLTREDMALLATFVGIYGIAVGRARLGVATIVCSLAYLLFAKFVMMPSPGLLMQDSKNTVSYFYYYEDMIKNREEGTMGLLLTLLTNPLFSLKVLLLPKKALFFLQLLVPLLFLPLLAGRKLLLCIYGMIFIGLASRRHVYSLHFQYSSVLFPALLFALPEGVARLSHANVAAKFGLNAKALQRALVWAVASASLLTTLKFGAYVPNGAFFAGWNRLEYIPSPASRERYLCLQELNAMVPPDAPLACSSTIGPHVSSRKQVALWPSYGQANYIMLRDARKKPKDRDKIDKLVREGTFELLRSCADLTLYQRKGAINPQQVAPPTDEMSGYQLEEANNQP